ncbi:hypothetical protein HYR99_04525 [Candidatus Poribacteria bacterium]|nr:hypothetical protein [Candidatus Poribacteria bacterium]
MMDTLTIALLGMVFVGTSLAEQSYPVSQKHKVLQEVTAKLTPLRIGVKAGIRC